jgi:hypothetical protein
MNSRYIVVAFAVLFNSCGNNYEFWDISKFRIDNEALADWEEVQLIYCSPDPQHDEVDFPFYTHMIVVSSRSGDTVNVLSRTGNWLSHEKKNQIFRFIKQESNAAKIIQKHFDEIKNTSEPTNQPTEQINKVCRDPKFDFLADNTFPSIIGVIGTGDSIEK